MSEKSGAPDFEILKDDRFEYHYSRNERVSRRRDIPLGKPAKKGFLAGWFGGNKSVRNFVLVYAAAGLLVCAGLYFFGNRSGTAERKSWNFGSGRSIDTRMISRDGKSGLNLLLNNRGKAVWTLNSVILETKSGTMQTNIRLALNPGDFEVIYWDRMDSANLTGIKAE